MDLLECLWQEEKYDTEEEERDGKRPRAEEGELSEQEEKEQQENKKVRVDAGEISDEELSKALRSSSSSLLSSLELEAEVETACSCPKISETVVVDNNSGGRHGAESKPAPKRIDTGIFSHIPPELLYHILKFLSSEVSRIFSICPMFMLLCL